MGSFSDRTALVTGSSRGIGAATAKRLGERGANVVVNFHTDADAATETADAIRSAGGEALVIQADVRQQGDVRAMVDRVHDQWGTIDVLVNNANMPFAKKPIAEMRWAEFSQKVTDELEAAFRVTKAVVPGMVDQGYGRAVYVSSGLGDHTAPGFVAHGTAKAALDTFTKYVAHEFGPDGITANVVAPGLVETDATADRIDDVRDDVVADTPLGRVAEPDDVAGMIVALASDDAQFVTGTYTPVNGGRDME